ncbi:DUF2617 family protein [Mycolicibacterium celeriflavum]|uniref:Uncharacterized protein n=1 Tax=Mycolicibacterium celeriflavum TaxID=1249101 RepID=A0A1X0BP61_MYCCF|nr:DUF2617 family protein [Mycolicibacterium celeriflavum]MCV7240325.1 DUF2617 family protein [Mycolicibacterium celeriflavum]ORA44234.1 hypothetical protein BST21_20020 [Mycolicibacterium celeriflavum]BBY43376.1 hypothetical protein MCEL_16710 [Mycolicibacterium celeriflavum]
MPFHRLVVNPADVSGTTLRLALNAPLAQPLATLPLTNSDGSTLVLGVLGASHLVTVEHPKHRFSEEVSCTARTDAALPGCAVAPGYRIESRTETYDTAGFRRLAQILQSSCERMDGWLGGAFPGDDAALTALAAEPDGTGWRWRTWHLYPDAAAGGTVVYTSSRWRP